MPGYKLVTELNIVSRNEIKLRLQNNTPGVGNWKNVGEKYGMSQIQLGAMESDQDRTDKVIQYISCSRPKLTVYEFCKYLKEIERNDIVEQLRDDLTTTDEKAANGRLSIDWLPRDKYMYFVVRF